MVRNRWSDPMCGRGRLTAQEAIVAEHYRAGKQKEKHMRLLGKLGRRLASLAAVGVIVAAANVSLASPAAAARYGWWLFRNVEEGTCLSVTSTGGVSQADCSFGPRQLWDWVGEGEGAYTQLRNQYSNRCLVTDHKSEINAVWTTVCAKDLDNVPAGMRWRRGDTPNTQIRLLSSLRRSVDRTSMALRTSPNRISVYAVEYWESDWALWREFPG